MKSVKILLYYKTCIKTFIQLYTYVNTIRQIPRRRKQLIALVQIYCNYLRQGGYGFIVVCAKTSERICMTFSGKVGNGPMNKQLNFGADPDHHLDRGIVFWIRHYWEIQKVVKGHKPAAASSRSFILISHMVGLIS